MANISEANISEANISEANISEANISEANISEANISEASISEEGIYKVAHVVNNIKMIYVFLGPHDSSKINKLFQRDPTHEIFQGCFSPEEIGLIKNARIQVKFLPDRLHLDDTIEIIKKKVLFYLMDELNIAFEEMYLFIIQPEKFQPHTLYQILTKNETQELTKARLLAFLINLEVFDPATLSDKPVYTYADLLQLNFTQNMGQSVGQKGTTTFIVNPYEQTADTEALGSGDDITIVTTNKQLLLEHGEPRFNTLYLCLAEDVLKYSQSEDLTAANMLRLYFPYLYDKNITTAALLAEQKQALLVATRATLNDAFQKNIANVNLFYDLFASEKKTLSFTNVGIKSILLTLAPDYPFNMPLDIVFKLLHATQAVPLIKYNPSARYERIYRLYADQIATNGKKIPYLDKGVIFKWDKVMGRNKSVAVYIGHTPIICEFENNGNITLKAEFAQAHTIDEINELFQREVNPVINTVKDYLAQTGYNIHNFIDISAKNVEIWNIDYALHLSIDKKVNIRDLIGCVSSVFDVVNDNLEQGITMRLKRVANYNEAESQEALILDMSKPRLGYTGGDIIKALQTNFNLTETVARTKFADVMRTQEVIQGANKRMKVRKNPGFLTTIVKQAFNNIIMINVSGINNLKYLKTIYIYISSLLRMTQIKKFVKYPRKNMKKLCETDEKIPEEPQFKELNTDIAVDMTDPSDPSELAEPSELLTMAEAVPEEITFYNPPAAAAIEEELDEADLLRFAMGNDEEEEEEETNYESDGGGGKTKKNADAESEAEAEDEADAEAESDAEVEDKAEAEVEVEAEAEAESDPEHDLVDIVGQSLSGPKNLFTQRFKKRDKKLFYSEDETSKSYSRTCQWNWRRQPVVLTDAEKEKIDKEHPGSYDQALKYGSSPDNQNWYICPRYWNIKENTSLSEAEVDPDNVISHKAKKVPKDKQIFEFNEYGKIHLDANKNYVKHYPGFLKPDDKGVCMPCCFKSWTGAEQVERREKCLATGPNPDEKKRKKKVMEIVEEYVLGNDKIPISQENRLGYLPVAIQQFLQTDNKKCQLSELNTNLKPNYICLLRFSVEIHPNQSFVGALCDIWFYDTKHTEPKKPTIKRMKEILIAALDIDRFVALQNGNLIKQFYKGAAAADAVAAAADADADESYVDRESYVDVFTQSDSKLFKTIDKNNVNHINTLIKIAKAYQNFLDYLRDETVLINYTHLWDLVCTPNPKLFPAGLNLVILALTQKDITDNVELICPANHYSNTFFDPARRTLFLIKKDKYYEPIYAYETSETEKIIERSFKISDKHTLPNIKRALTMINTVLNTKCGPRASMPHVYKFEQNIPLEKLIHQLALKNYAVEAQVTNYAGKAIGVVAVNNASKKKGFLPCFPSAVLVNKSKVIWMDDVYTDTYENTKTFLEQVYKETNKKVPCKPYMKILEDGLIVGILTLTDQFVMLSEPTQDTYGDDLKRENTVNYTKVDKTVSNSLTDTDMDRVLYIKKIRLETMFYNVFRNSVRYLLGQYEHTHIRKELEEKSRSTQLYLKKLQSIEQLLRDLMTEHVVFHNYTEAELLALDKVPPCHDAECSLTIPATNLINGIANDKFYFGKLADEIVRFTRINTFIFQPKQVLSFSSVKYNLRENEIILLQSLLTQEYFDDIIPAEVNPYTKYNTYDSTKPLKSQTYTNIVDLNRLDQETEVPREERKCTKKTYKVITGIFWDRVFPPNSKELVLNNNSHTCSFESILIIIRHFTTNMEITTHQLKEFLAEEYAKLYPLYKNVILRILSMEGKKIICRNILNHNALLTDIIISEEYYLTNLDIWVLALRFNIPLILITEPDVKFIENNTELLFLNASQNGEYYFVKMSKIVNENAPSVYSIITTEQNNAKIKSASLINELIKKNIRVAETSTEPDNYLVRFFKSMTAKIVRKPPAQQAQAPAAQAAPAVKLSIKKKLV